MYFINQVLKKEMRQVKIRKAHFKIPFTITLGKVDLTKNIKSIKGLESAMGKVASASINAKNSLNSFETELKFYDRVFGNTKNDFLNHKIV
jgi:hypothetical protein